MPTAAAQARYPLTQGVNPWLVTASVMLPTFMEVLDTAIASVALPYIAGSLSASNSEATWVLTSYLVANAVILPASNWFARRFGRKRFLLTCVIIFTVASFFCGAAPSLGVILLARVMQGAGGGALQPLSQSILLESFPVAQRSMSMAAYGLGIVVAPVIGPTLGGWLTDTFSWRYAFYINVPVGLLAVFMVSRFVHDPPYIKNAKVGPFDNIGFGLLMVWTGALQIVLDKGQEDDWFGALWVRWAVTALVVALLLWIWRSWSNPKGLVDLHVLKDRNFRTGCILITMLGMCIYITIAILGSRIDNRKLLTAGFLGFATCAFIFGTVDLDIGPYTLLIPITLTGFALSFVFVPLSTMMMATIPNKNMGSATGLANMLRNIGGSIGISMATTALIRRAALHQTYLGANLTPSNAVLQQKSTAIAGYLAHHVGTAQARPGSFGFLYGLMEQQSAMMAYVDVFRWTAVLALICAAAAWLFKKPVKPAAPPPGVH